MTPKKKLIIHPGLAKCGTTLLQKEVFPTLSNQKRALYLGRFYNNSAISYRGAAAELHNLSSKPLNRSVITTLREELDQNEADTGLFSSESILKPFPPEIFLRNLSLLKEFFEIRFIVTIRDPIELIQSRFAHDLKKFKHNFTIEEVVVFEGECNYPMCRDPKTKRNYVCHCSKNGFKKIFANLYSKRFLNTVYFSDSDVRYYELIKSNTLQVGELQNMISDIFPNQQVGIQFENISAVNKGDRKKAHQIELDRLKGLLAKNRWYKDINC